MAWSDIIGQHHVKEILKRLIDSNRLPHAMLLYGPKGCGQDPIAIELAKVLNCEKGSNYACDKCPSCLSFKKLQHPKLKLVFPMPVKPGEGSAIEKMTKQELDEINEQVRLKAENAYHRIAISKASVIKVSSIRDIIREGAFRSTGRGRTVVILLDAEKMNLNAANALLKSLEEPTGDMMFILTTSNRDALLQTIRSRCQQLRFEPLSSAEITKALEQKGDYSDEAIRTAAHLSAGSYSAALNLLEDEPLIGRQEVLDYLRIVVMNKPVDLMQRIQNYAKIDDRQQVIFFLALLQVWFRDILALREGMSEKVMNTDFIDSMKKFAGHYPHADCELAIDSIDVTIDMLSKNVHFINALLVLSLKLREAIMRKDPFVHVKRISI
jgi:DNA polymerase III subunit delta'